MNNTNPLCEAPLFMISTELVIQEKACDMIRLLESSYLNITDPAGARGNECLGTKQSVVEWRAIV